MWNDSYEWHFDYPRLAFDAGFFFNNSKTKYSFQRETIKNLDINKLIQDRNTSAIEKHIPSIIDYSLDNEQTSILDPSFVKIFQLSQLAVEYLLFCKKYLDNTVVILKKTILNNAQEIEDLKGVLEENEKCQHHNRPCTEDSPGTFQCSKCYKLFASREFLVSHQKRRHQGPRSTWTFQEETDKLQMEIKELKERLNSTEKLVQDGDFSKKELSQNETVNVDQEKRLVMDLHQKFELLKVYLENELKTLHFQSPDQSRYEKWFELVLQKLESVNIFHNKKTEFNNNSVKKDNSTQTEEYSKNEQIIITKDFSQTDEQIEMVKKLLVGFKENTDVHFNAFENTLTKKVDSTLKKLDKRIESLSNKITLVEKYSKQICNREEPLNEHNFNRNSIFFARRGDDDNVGNSKPIPKKRQFISKMVKPNESNLTEEKKRSSEVSPIEQNSLDIPTVSSSKMESNQSRKISFKKHNPIKGEKSSDEEPSIKINHAEVKPSNSTLHKKRLKQPRSKTIDLKKEGIKMRLNKIFVNRLNSYGITSSQTGINHDRYKKALFMIQQKKEKNRKVYPQYERVISYIVKVLNSKINLNKSQRNIDKMQVVADSWDNENKGNVQFKCSDEKEVILEKHEMTDNRGTLVKRPLEKSFSSSSEENETTSITEEHLKGIPKPNKNLEDFYKSYSNVVKEMNKKIKRIELKKANKNGTSSKEHSSSEKSEDNSCITITKESHREIGNRSGKNERMKTTTTTTTGEIVIVKPLIRENDDESEHNLTFVHQQNPKSIGGVNQVPLKKKVIFQSQASGIVMANNDDDDSTSVTSSVFDNDGSPRFKKKVIDKNRESDISDFNFSDILT